VGLDVGAGVSFLFRINFRINLKKLSHSGMPPKERGLTEPGAQQDCSLSHWADADCSVADSRRSKSTGLALTEYRPC
jgi:hypothetical protein